MAKIARCGYGSQGQGRGKNAPDGYTYVVNDNVRTGDKIQVIATSVKGRKFATTAVPLSQSVWSENTLKGKLAKQEVKSITGEDPTRVYSGKELGVAPITQKGVKKEEYIQATRAGNIAMELKKNPKAELTPLAQQTYDEYAKQFMQGEKK